jgi:cleavage and polyadenylation specificity factor subunit 2
MLMSFQMNHKVPLQGAELEAFQQKERAAKEKEAAHQAALARNQRMLEADEDESDSDTDSDAEDEDEVQRTLAGDLNDTEMDGSGSPGVDVARRKIVDRGVDGVDWGLDGDEGLTKQLLSFDIYIKGNVSKATSFFKSAGGQAQRFRMFPYVEKKRRVDEYGETIDVGMWLRKGKVLEEDAAKEEANESRNHAEEDVKVRLRSRLSPSKS